MTLSTSTQAHVCRWDNTVQTFRIPDELARLLNYFLLRCHHIFSPNSAYVFTNGRGQRFEQAANFNYYWGKLSRRIGVPASIPPTRYTLVVYYCGLSCFAYLEILDILLSPLTRVCGLRDKTSHSKLHFCKLLPMGKPKPHQLLFYSQVVKLSCS